MAAVLGAFGIDWRLLLINSINFGLLLLALWYFLYGPLMRMLKERQEKVAQGVRDAQAAGERLSEIEHSRSALLSQAGKEADEMLEKARAAAAQKGKELLAQSEQAAGVLLRDAEQEARELKAQALQESKEDVAKLVVLGLEKALAQQ